MFNPTQHESWFLHTIGQKPEEGRVEYFYTPPYGFARIGISLKMKPSIITIPKEFDLDERFIIRDSGTFKKEFRIDFAKHVYEIYKNFMHHLNLFAGGPIILQSGEWEAPGMFSMKWSNSDAVYSLFSLKNDAYRTIKEQYLLGNVYANVFFYDRHKLEASRLVKCLSTFDIPNAIDMKESLGQGILQYGYGVINPKQEYCVLNPAEFVENKSYYVSGFSVDFHLMSVRYWEKRSNEYKIDYFTRTTIGIFRLPNHNSHHGRNNLELSRSGLHYINFLTKLDRYVPQTLV